MIESIRAPYSYFLFDIGGFTCFALIWNGLGRLGATWLGSAYLLFDI